MTSEEIRLFSALQDVAREYLRKHHSRNPDAFKDWWFRRNYDIMVEANQVLKKHKETAK